MKKIKNNDIAWEILFDRYNILQQVEKNWIFQITAEQIKEEREPRLMTKFDHEEDLPRIFKNNHISILPVNRWTYVLWKFSTHENIKYDEKIPFHKINLRPDLESLDVKDLFSESVALNYALATWMLREVIWEDCELTVSWKMSSSKFNFNVKDSVSQKKYIIDVDRAQVEIDWGYESTNKLMIIEAKKWKCDDFIIRQLYYPYRLRKGKIDKEVIPVFMTVSNWIFSFFVFKFEKENDYNSIHLVKQINYAVDFEPITENDVKYILDSSKIIEEPEIPFPQADDFEKCINILEILKSWEKTKDEIKDEYDFVIRQAHYYVDADKYLWLVQDDKWMVSLTRLGKKIIFSSRKERNLLLIKQIFSHEIFMKVYRQKIKQWRVSRKDLVNMMKECKLYNIESDITYARRASTISWWLRRIDRTLNEKEI